MSARAEALTADDEIFNPEHKYYFFDESSRKIHETTGHRRVDDEWLGSFGLRVVKIECLRSGKRDALSDGQNFFKKQVEDLKEMIDDFEAEKADK